MDNDELLWYALRPGVEQWAKRWDCVLDLDGFVYVLRRATDTIKLDINHMVSLAKEDKYDEMQEYVKERCLNG